MPNTPQGVHAAWVSDRHLRLSFGDLATSHVLERVHGATRRLLHARPAGLVDATAAYTTLLLEFDLRTLDAPATVADVLATLTAIDAPAAPDDPRASSVTDRSTLQATEHHTRSRLIEIPVCYEGEFAPDIADVAAHCNLSPEGVASAHAACEYTVCFVGFAPGFGYLAGLPEHLSTPRLPRPRTRVPAGSVAIAGEQTGVYPQATPGGWRLIGRTPLVMFDALREEPSLLAMGDRVRFTPISPERFHQLASAGGRDA